MYSIAYTWYQVTYFEVEQGLPSFDHTHSCYQGRLQQCTLVVEPLRPERENVACVPKWGF